jgi:hypothetical protein
MAWQDTLRSVLEDVYDPLENERVAWVVVGSTATALQGCGVTPHDLDLLTQEPASVSRFAELLAPFAAAESSESFFLSTRAVPVYVGPMGGMDWHFGRWMIGGLSVEVAHIAAPEGHPALQGDGVWECGPAIWPHIRRASFEGYSVPVVPLEIQVQANFVRGHTESGENLLCRVEEIARAFREGGYDRALLEWAMDAAHLARFDEVMQAEQRQNGDSPRIAV